MADTVLPTEKIVRYKGGIVSVLMAPHYGPLGEMGFKQIIKQICFG